MKWDVCLLFLNVFKIKGNRDDTKWVTKSSGVVFQSWAIAVAFLVQSAFIFFCERDAWSSGVGKCARGGVIERDQLGNQEINIYINIYIPFACEPMRSIATFQRVCSNSIVLPRNMFFVEFDFFFLISFFKKEKIKNNLTSSGVHAVDSALVRINSAIHITSSLELLASILNLYILHHVSECHFLTNIINNNKEFVL